MKISIKCSDNITISIIQLENYIVAKRYSTYKNKLLKKGR